MLYYVISYCSSLYVTFLCFVELTYVISYFFVSYCMVSDVMLYCAVLH